VCENLAPLFVIASDAQRFRPMIIPSILEKVSYAGAILVLYLQDRISPVEAASAVPDAILAVLFMAAFFSTRPRTSRPPR
jgi:hypothetical protein